MFEYSDSSSSSSPPSCVEEISSLASSPSFPPSADPVSVSAVAVRELVDEPVDELIVVLDDPVSSVSSFEFVLELVVELVGEVDEVPGGGSLVWTSGYFAVIQ